MLPYNVSTCEGHTCGETSVFFSFVVGIGEELGARLRGWGGNVSLRLEIAISSASGSSLVNSVMAKCEQHLFETLSSSEPFL